VQCLNESAAPGCDECGDYSNCGIRLAMTDVMEAISSVLETTKLADMIERYENASRIRSKIVDFSI
jgi:DNA-binding IscR family transcriptional regulator